VKDGLQPTVGPNPTITPVNSSYISVWNIMANVGIWTAPGTDPAYVATDVLLLGTGGVSALGAAEATIRTRFEGFTTDPFRFAPTDPNCQDPAFAKAAGSRCSIVDVYGYDVDPCSGTVSDRPWGGIDVDPGPPTGVKPGRWRFRPPSRMIPLAGASGVFDPPTQQMHARLRGATPTLTKNGLLAGQYVAPTFEFIFPENVMPGDGVVPFDLWHLPFLRYGEGDQTASGVGPLEPTPWGAPVSDLPPLPAAVEAAAYRIAVEALTNAVRHSGCGRVDVRIRADGRLHVEVIDNGQATQTPWPAGVGLTSMRERAAELGGACEAGPVPEGGRVTAVLPLEVR
jgi:hypothetical protein